MTTWHDFGAELARRVYALEQAVAALGMVAAEKALAEAKAAETPAPSRSSSPSSSRSSD
jgi:hypothetical protein